MGKNSRAFAKAVSWRVVGTIDTFLVAWFVTGALHLAGGVALLEILTKVTLYFLHERAWDYASPCAAPVNPLREVVEEGAELCAYEEADDMVVAYYRQSCKEALAKEAA
jgi:uncharacterized membrane protein